MSAIGTSAGCSCAVLKSAVLGANDRLSVCPSGSAAVRSCAVKPAEEQRGQVKVVVKWSAPIIDSLIGVTHQ